MRLFIIEHWWLVIVKVLKTTAKINSIWMKKSENVSINYFQITDTFAE